MQRSCMQFLTPYCYIYELYDMLLHNDGEQIPQWRHNCVLLVHLVTAWWMVTKIMTTHQKLACDVLRMRSMQQPSWVIPQSAVGCLQVDSIWLRLAEPVYTTVELTSSCGTKTNDTIIGPLCLELNRPRLFLGFPLIPLLLILYQNSQSFKPVIKVIMG